MKTRPYLLHALSPLHVGTGQSVGLIDLPIARMRATGLPFVPGSSLKGVLREARKRAGLDTAVHAALFGPQRLESGPEGDTELEHAGALVVGDARLVALPVRSFKGTFALVTSPLLLELARRDLAGNVELPRDSIPRPLPYSALVAGDCINVHEPRGKTKSVYLEDLVLPVKESPVVTAWARVIVGALPTAELALPRFVVVDDETMDFLWETATQLDTRVRIDAQSGTVADGALWTEESLPAETLLLGLLSASSSFKQGTPIDASQVLTHALPDDGEVVQLGGKATVGRGRCHLISYPRRET